MVKTNNHWRPLLPWHDLTQKEQENADNYAEVKDSTFFRYRKQIYDLNDFVPVGEDLDSDWDKMESESAFSAMLVKHSKNKEFVRVGWSLN